MDELALVELETNRLRVKANALRLGYFTPDDKTRLSQFLRTVLDYPEMGLGILTLPDLEASIAGINRALAASVGCLDSRVA